MPDRAGLEPGDVGGGAKARRLHERERPRRRLVLDDEHDRRELRIRRTAARRTRHRRRVALEIVDLRRRQRRRAVRTVEARGRPQEAVGRLDLELERPDLVVRRDHPRRRLRLRWRRARQARAKGLEARGRLGRRSAPGVRRIADRDRLHDVDAVLVERRVRAETVLHDRARTRDERRHEGSANRRSLVAEIGVTDRRRLPREREQPGDRAERRRHGGESRHPMAFSFSASSAIGSTASRDRAPASARRPPSRKAFRIL